MNIDKCGCLAKTEYFGKQLEGFNGRRAKSLFQM